MFSMTTASPDNEHSLIRVPIIREVLPRESTQASTLKVTCEYI